MPSVDLVDMYLRLAEKYNMKFYFGLYDSGRYWDTGDLSWELEESKNSFFRYEGLKLYLFWGGMVCNILVFLMLLMVRCI